MKIRGLILGNGLGRIVTDGRTLNAMARAGHFERVSPLHPYVDEGDRPKRFTFKGEKYTINYFDGCFNPFVLKTPLTIE